ncbi:dead deah box helicase [Diplodia corticola]|uniref:Dead deah box helicase n=1 Tax=Diplodia corticola TaxID=236234 RepID=A0A1J9S1J6_9PEZI|nr:dead deah box helicase [Diplodia corticola]OJD33892.1 dead deah box helicase [Diplodia corticola]
MAADGLPPPDWDHYYASLYSRRVDLVGDFAGSEPFLVEGDSLLLHCFSDRLLDFKDGFQMLHAVWLVEHFLHNLQRRNCNFHLAFFDDRDHLCIPPHANQAEKAKYRLARAVVVRHLQANLARDASPIKLFTFPSPDSHSFRTALAANAYMFVMMNDGAADPCQCTHHAQSKHELRLAICLLVTCGYSVALINGLEWRDTKAITAVIEGENSSHRPSMPKADDHAAQPDADAFGRELYDALSEHHGRAEQKLSERVYLAIATAANLVSAGDIPHPDIAAFFRHAVLQNQLSLESRSSNSSASTEASQRFFHQFSESALAVMNSPLWKTFLDETELPCDVGDLVDGRLYNTVVAGRIPLPHLDQDFTSLVASLVALDTTELERQPSGTVDESVQAPEELSKSSRQLLPFADGVFDKHLQPVKLDGDDQAVQHPKGSASRAFRELTHWNNVKRPLNRKAVLTAKERANFYARRRDQRFMAEMMAYAASLTNAVGKALEPETVITQDGQSVASRASKGQQQAGQSAKAGGGKNKQKQAMLDKIAAEHEKKEAVQNQKVINSWHAVCKDIQRDQQPAVRYSKALQYLASISSSKQAVIGFEIELYALNCLLELWKTSVSSNQASPNFALAAKIWDTVGRLSSKSGITKTMREKLLRTVDSLGLPFPIPAAELQDRKLPFDFTLHEKDASLKVPLPSKEFQLLHCGPYFDRKMDSAPDDRVSFVPDGWQRKVLDVVDAEKSLFVVAPTSAGKTFISFYAMKKALESSDDGVLVYVAPTKALVNQIAAEIQARFSKVYKHAGKSVWAIHTRDYRVNNSTGCQILVTVPDILQMMLLAPSNANSWSSRLKRIIYDEVHCIGQADDGIVWEQLLLLSSCPIIALSATVGNPEEFRSWLASAQKAIGNELVMVHHPHRYSDLRKYVYVPPKTLAFEGLPKAPVVPRVDLDRSEDFRFAHPVASLLDRSRGMPKDFSLEARDCFTLWKAMKAHESDTYAVPDSLDPKNALPGVITQAAIITWCESLKEVFQKWMAEHDSPFDSVVRDLGRGLHELEAENDTALDHASLSSTALPLLCRLQEQSALPAIMFNYDRGTCESICESVLTELKEAEDKWKKTSPVWAKKLDDWETWKKSRKGMSKKTPNKKSATVEKGMSKADLEKEAASTEIDSWGSFDPEAPLDGFHFKDAAKLQQSELEVYADELQWRGVQPWLIEALSRGIAVHHAGMNRKYRHVVELLFRKGYLRVIVATGTLALGINMPCKTVVFCGDSISLTALNYRQAAGRAGRRGFDVLGNVVFHGVPVSKVRRLLSSSLPDLTGHFPITTTLVLRLCNLLSESKHSAFAVRSINALLSQPRLCLGGDENHVTVLHHLRFSLEYLRRQFLLDQSGNPLNFAGCVSNLYYTESSNFAFHALLRDGYFHRLCAGIRQTPDSIERILSTVVLVLSHIFGRRYNRQVDREFVEEVAKRSPSSILLAPLPADAARILHAHNRDALDVFKTYVRTYVAQHVSEPDNILPLTGVKCGGGDAGSPTPAPPAPQYTIRSPFVALSGHTDDEDIATIAELCRTVRAGVFLEEAVIPHVPVQDSEEGSDEETLDLSPLNAYLLDFFKHGDVTALAEANGIRRGDVWFVLQDFSMVLATIVTSLEELLKMGAGGDGGDETMEEMADRLLEGSTAAAAGAATPGVAGKENNKALPVRGKKVAKKAVAESWDDDDGDDDEESWDADGAAGADEALNSLAWEDDGEGSLLDVLVAFKKVSEEFNEKFKAMWA